MGTIERKKELMQVAKKNLMFFVVILIWNHGHAQNITGKFQRIDPLTAARDIGVEFSFKENLEFERSTYEHLGAQEKSHGSYEISEDTLILNYKKFQGSCGNIVEIAEKEKIESYSGSDLKDLPIYSLIQIFEAPGVPAPGVNLLLRKKDEDVIMAFVSNDKGFFPNLSIYDRYINEFHFSALGKQETSIKTDPLFGFRTKLKIFLEDASKKKISKETTEKYLIKKMTDQEIELVSLDGEELVLLERIQKN